MRLDHLLSKEQRELRGRIDVWWSEKLINCLILRELQERRELVLSIGLELSWLERTPDKREVDGSSPFRPIKNMGV